MENIAMPTNLTHRGTRVLQRFGCGWYGTDKLWRVVPFTRQFAIIPIELDSRAAFRGRNVWMVTDPVLHDAWRLGRQVVNPGHALIWVIPREKYEAEHPEYFGAIQPCLTHPDVIQIAVDFTEERIKAARGNMHIESLTPIDGAGFCNCERCQGTGNVGARITHFANAIAAELDKRGHADKYQLWFLAYWVTHAPPRPMIKTHPTVKVMMVNEGNHSKSWDQPEDPQIVASTDRNNTRSATVHFQRGRHIFLGGSVTFLL